VLDKTAMFSSFSAGSLIVLLKKKKQNEADKRVKHCGGKGRRSDSIGREVGGTHWRWTDATKSGGSAEVVGFREGRNTRKEVMKCPWSVKVLLKTQGCSKSTCVRKKESPENKET